MHYESIRTRWDSTNPPQMPTRTSNDEAVPMEVDMVMKGKNGKGEIKNDGKSKQFSFKAKGKSEKGKSKRKDNLENQT